MIKYDDLSIAHTHLRIHTHYGLTWQWLLLTPTVVAWV